MAKWKRPLKLGQEYPIPGEDKFIFDMVHELEGQLNELYSPGKTERQAHPKQHGLLKAEFIIAPDIPSELKVGIFEVERSYPAYIRYSSFSTKIQSDYKKDVRGMALKIFNVPGEKLITAEAHQEIQDFLLVSNETFFIDNVKDFEKLIRGIVKGLPGIIKYVLSNPFKHLPTLMRAKSEFIRVGNLLNTPFWSCVPYQFGNESKAVKYHARPRDGQQPRIPKKPNPWYLREAMMDTLKEQEVWFDFMIQIQEDPYSEPIENPKVKWKTPFIKLASIRIPKQDFTSTEQFDLGQNLSFSPWHSLPVHRPIGGLNRARRAIYATMAKFRLERDQIPTPKIKAPEMSPSNPAPTNKEIVEVLLKAYQAKDVKKVLDMMSDDIEWFAQGDPTKVPLAGTWNGKKEVMELFTKQASLIEPTIFTVKGLIGADDGATQVLSVHEKVLVKATKKFYDMDFVMLISVNKDGKVNHVESIMDTLAVAEAFS